MDLLLFICSRCLRGICVLLFTQSWGLSVCNSVTNRLPWAGASPPKGAREETAPQLEAAEQFCAQVGAGKLGSPQPAPACHTEEQSCNVIPTIKLQPAKFIMGLRDITWNWLRFCVCGSDVYLLKNCLESSHLCLLPPMSSTWEKEQKAQPPSEALSFFLSYFTIETFAVKITLLFLLLFNMET